MTPNTGWTSYCSSRPNRPDLELVAVLQSYTYDENGQSGTQGTDVSSPEIPTVDEALKGDA